MDVLTKMVGFVTTNQPDAAKAFYGQTLNFRLVAEDDFALVFDANGTTLRVGKGRDFTPAPHTVLGWEVRDIEAAVRELGGRGVRFEHYALPFLKQDDLGIWTAPGGDKVAWFKDPDGNVLSVSQHGG